MRDLYHRRARAAQRRAWNAGRIRGMSEPAPSCPRCRVPLQPVQLEGVSVHACATCHGTRFEGTRLGVVLEAMSAKLLETLDLDMRLERAGASADRLACSACGREMAHDDYCSAGLALFDRCEPCTLLWVDAESLGTMALMWARMDAQQSRRAAETKQLLDGADDLVTRTLVGRAVTRALFRFLG
jgi:Zn-finger nucleic acid-binding protein